MALVKFPLIMADDSKCYTLEQLKEHFDIGSVVNYFHDRRLIRWLKINRYNEEFASLEKLSTNERNLAQKLGAIFGFEIPPDILPDNGGDIPRIINYLKQFTDDKKLLSQVEQEISDGTAFVARNQTELDEEEAQFFDKIYLVSDEFVIPLDRPNKIYIGIGDKARAVIKSDKPVNLERLHIKFESIRVEGITKFFDEILDKVKPHADKNLLAQIRQDLQNETAQVVFDQAELDEHIRNFDKIYLFENQFVIPLNRKSKTYIGVGDKAVAVIESEDTVNFDELNVKFENVSFDDNYRALKLFEEADFAYVEGDKTTALKKYKQSAEFGYVRAFAEIGIMYELGDGVEKDINEARSWYKLGMEKDDGDSFGWYALSLQTGYESESAKREAFNCMKRATELNPKWGGWWKNLGDMYYEGTGTNKNLGEAFRCYEKGTEAGNSDATNMLGIMYGWGEYVSLDKRKAFELYKKAVELNDKNTTAVINLAYCYRYGEGVAQDYYKAFELYKQAAEAGDVEAMADTADMLVDGKGVEQDKDKAFYWLKKSVDTGNDDVRAIRNLAIAYHFGTGTPQNFSKAFDLYQRAANSGDGIAMNRIGLMYNKGQGVTQDDHIAFQWYVRAADAGNADGMSNMSLCYLWGMGVPTNINNAIYWMKKAAENGVYYGMLQYANWLYSQDPTDYRLIGMYEQAANAGYGEAAYKLSLMHKQGCRPKKGSSVMRNTALANHWERKYKELGYEPD